MRWSTEFRTANRRRWKEKERQSSVTAIYIFISQPCVDSEKSPSIVAKGEKKFGFFSPHGVNEAMLLKTTDVSSRPRRCCLQATPPPPGTTNHFTCQSFKMGYRHCTVCSDLQCAHLDPPLLFIGFHHESRAVHKSGFQMCFQPSLNRLCL